MSEKFYEALGPETPEIMERFSGRLFREEDITLDEAQYERLIAVYEQDFSAALDELLTLWNSKEHRETLGHDTVHISYDLLEYLYLVKSVPLLTSERYLVLFGSLLHDLGRYPELLMQERSGAVDFRKGRQIQFHAALSGYLSALLARRHKGTGEIPPEISQASKAFNRRVIGAALFHGGTNEERDPVVHHVQSIDRLAGILGSREFVRNVVTDGVQRGAALYPDERLSYDRTFPLFNNLPVAKFQDAEDPTKSWTNIVHYLEMPMRNMYPLSTPYGMERAAAMRRESGIILTLLAGGEGTKLYDEIFAPEQAPDQQFSFPKNRLPDEIWKGIVQGLSEDETRKMQGCHALNTHDLIDTMLDQQAFTMPPADRQRVHVFFDSVPAHHAGHIRSAIEYVVARRELNTVTERKFLEEVAHSSDPLIAKIAAVLKESRLFA